MKKEYTLIHPDIDDGRGRTHELIGELVSSWRNGANEGAAEISAVCNLLTQGDELPNIYKTTPEGPTGKLAAEFFSFLALTPDESNQITRRVKKDKKWQALPVYVTGFSSATGALYTALAAARVAGGEVITTSLNYVGVVNAILMAGAMPRFVDINPRTFCMDFKCVQAAVTRSTKAVILTHLNRFEDLKPYYDMWKRRGFDFPLLQDASLAIGSRNMGLRPGVVNIGTGGVTVFSLTVSKIISGLGGALAASHDPAVLNQMHEIAYQGVDESDPAIVNTFGTNFKMSALNAAIANEQLKRRSDLFERRIHLMNLYEENLRPLTKTGKVKIQDIGVETVVTHLPILLSVQRAQVAARLYSDYGIQTGVWHSHHTQNLYKMLLGKKKSKLPRTEKISERLIFLPFHTKLKDEDVSYICGALRDVL